MASTAAVLAIQSERESALLLERLAADPLVDHIAVSAPPNYEPQAPSLHRLQNASLDSAMGVVEVLRWFESTGATHLLWIRSPRCELATSGLRRLMHVATDSQAALLYSDCFDQQSDDAVALHPLIDYQPGSLRDDFDFGHVVVLSRSTLNGLAEVILTEQVSADFGGWYDLRLRVSERGSVVHLCEPAYSVRTVTESMEGEGHFQYVDPRNRDYQLEMERIATAHLKRINVWLPPPTTKPIDDSATFPVECSVVIPVRNRERTVADAVGSALSQQADFPFNVIVVDNHSSDGTSKVLSELALQDSRVTHLVPDRKDLGIGGCWNEAIYAAACGRYAVQLDSDDLYANSDVLSRIVAEFRAGDYAMVIGSYTLVDFQLQQIPPGLIDHREWTADNGHNNALRIAGLGAPRAFHVPTLRTLGFPNVSYGEDYAVALRLCRQYRLGRIYDSLYLCRRWEGNTDHALPLETQNRYAAYKDRVRSLEIVARQQMSRSAGQS